MSILNNTIENNQCTNLVGNLAGPGCRGGGVDSWLVTVYLIDNAIKNNRINSPFYSLGAGVDLWRSSTPSIIQGNTIASNSVTSQSGNSGGGGIELVLTQGVQVIGNRFVENYGAAWGGGISDQGIGTVIAENEFHGNSTDPKFSAGGGIACYDSKNITITRNLFKENSAFQCGGLASQNSELLLTNNLFTLNKAQIGGAIGVSQVPPQPLVNRIINNTITANSADTAAGIWLEAGVKLILLNNICWGNDAAFSPEIYVKGGDLNVTYSDIRYGADGIMTGAGATVNWLAGNIDTNPLFAFSNYQLSNSSLCIGAGAASMQIGGTTYNCPNSDMEGNPRPNPPGSKPDIGAYENPLGTASGPILVPEQYASIQSGINAARDGDMVLVRDNTYYENINFKGKAITVASYYLIDGDTAHVNNTIIDGSKPSHADSGSVVFFISGEDTTSVLCGFTITKGSGTEIRYLWNDSLYSERSGGGILCFNAGARIVSNKIIENAVYSAEKEAYGGGVNALNFGSTAFLIIEDNQISHNKVTADKKRAYCGGLALWCNTILLNNQIEYNSVVANTTPLEAFAGGLACYSDLLDRREFIIESNKMSHNSVTSYNSNAKAGGCLLQGGIRGRFTKNEVNHNEIWVKTTEYAIGAGMWIVEVANSFVLEDNIFRENAVKQGNGHGGGVAIGWNSSLPVINNIIEGNSVTNGGGFFIHSNSSPQIINNTIIDNKATTGGGFFVRGNSTVYLMNTILWNNKAPTHPAIHIEAGTVQAAYCDIQGGWSGTGNINADPLFADTLFQLSNSSLCIGAGVASLDLGGIMCCCPKTDIAGNYRPDPAGSSPDIGAYESPLGKRTEVLNSTLTEIPKSYFLAQNCPNPFNPSTTIEFALPKSAFVTLKVYNLLGEEVATLVAEQRLAGIHRINWDVRGLASGVYLYRVEAGTFVQSKKLILMR